MAANVSARSGPVALRASTKDEPVAFRRPLLDTAHAMTQRVGATGP
ncbi:hypothetical protein [uncultured Sphingomonas sp.]|nr:hypothetical protein [uncultured Sphingomonas sp.]